TDRAELWRDAVDWLAAALPAVPGYGDARWPEIRDDIAGRPPPAVGRTADRSVLALHMDALAALLQAGHPLPDSAARTEDVLLLHERRYWENAAVARGLELGSVSRHRAVAVASGWTAAGEVDALRILSSVIGLRDLDEDRSVEVARW